MWVWNALFSHTPSTSNGFPSVTDTSFRRTSAGPPAVGAHATGWQGGGTRERRALTATQIGSLGSCGLTTVRNGSSTCSRCSARSPEGLGVSDVARNLGVHRSTASRLLGTLAVERHGRTRRVDPAIPTRRPHGRARRDGRRQASGREPGPTGARGAVGVHVGDGEPRDPRSVPRGLRRPGDAGRDRGHGELGRSPQPRARELERQGACSRSATSRARRALLRRRLEASTDRTITDPGVLGEVLNDVRRRGYATSDGELEDGLVTIAAPVLIDGRAVAAVSISGPAYPRAQRAICRGSGAG